MSNFKYPKGSEWRKWDLHFHTPSSFDYKDKSITNELIINRLLYNKIKVVAITDHHKMDFGRLKNIQILAKIQEITVFPGIELITDKGGSESIHIIGIFPEDIDIETVWTKISGRLNITEKDIQEKGDNKIYVPLKDTVNLIHELGGLVTIHAGSKSNTIENITNSLPYKMAQKEDILKCIDVFEMGKSADIDDYLVNVIPNISHIKRPPMIVCSDNHDIKDYSLKSNLWIKADPTFEGLKQIIYEPELRVRIQEENPRENEVYARIEKCEISFPPDLKIKIEESGEKTDFCLQGKYEIEFSNNLTGIIGGRGTGKSTLIHLLCNAYPKKDISKLEELNSPILSINLVPDPLRQLADLTTTEIPTNTEFFLQNEIEKFARDIHEMSNLIRLRLLLLSSLNNQISLKDLQNEWSMTSQAMNEIIEAYDNISRATKNIESVNKQIDTLKKQIDVIKSKEYQNFQKIIEDINSKIAEFKRYEDEYNDIIAKIDGLITAFSQLEWSIEQGKGILDELSDLLGDYKKRLKESFNQLSNIFKTNNYTLQLTEKKFQLKKYLEKKGLTEENIEELANASEQIKELEGEIRILERQKVPFEKIYKKRKSILNEYKKKYLAYQNRFFEVATRLEKELQGLPFFDKAISFTPKINKQRLQEDIVTFVKNSSQAKITLRTNDIQSVLFDVEDITEYLKSKEKIRDCVNQSTKTVLHKQIIQGLVNDSVFLEKLYLLLWEKYYNIRNIQVQTKLGDKLLQNTSFGERCGIVISIILIAGTNPIVIDQPEDNLDGKFISNVLVPLIRKRKLCRQIILVTRDANIVIGGDAELVHILESDENEKKTKILPSSIENIKYRENYIWILDGGKEAFEKREKKYGFKTS